MRRTVDVRASASDGIVKTSELPFLNRLHARVILGRAMRLYKPTLMIQGATAKAYLYKEGEGEDYTAPNLRNNSTSQRRTRLLRNINFTSVTTAMATYALCHRCEAAAMPKQLERRQQH